MKKDLIVAGVLLLIAALGIGFVSALPFLQRDEETVQKIKSQPEPVAAPSKKG